MDKHILVYLPFLILAVSFLVCTPELVAMDEAEFVNHYPAFIRTMGPGHPGYFYLLGALMNLFGDAARTIKVFSFATGMLTMFFTYRLVKEKVGAEEARLSLYLLLALPFFWFHSLFGEVYVPTALLLISGFYYFEKHRPNFDLAALLFGLAFAFHEAVIVIVPALAYMLNKREGWRRVVRAALIFAFPPLLLYGVLAYTAGFANWLSGVFPLNVWVLGEQIQKEVTTTTLSLVLRNIAVIGATLNFVGLFAIMSAFSLKKMRDGARRLAKSTILLIAIFILFPILPLVGGSPTLVILSPFLAILASIYLIRLKKDRKIIALFVAFILLLNAAFSPIAFMLSGEDHPTYKLAMLISEEVPNDLCIHSCLEGSGEEKFFTYYLKEYKLCTGNEQEFYVTSNCLGDLEGTKTEVSRLNVDTVPYPWIQKEHIVYRLTRVSEQ